jgi:DNA-binding MarR family transcriptional regulator
MKISPNKTTVSAWARLMRVQQKALAQIESALVAARFPPLVWYDVLLELERVGEAGLRPFELEREMLLAQYNLSRLVDRIEKAGYVERRACKDDARGHIIVITASGKDLRRKMWPIYAQAIQGCFGDYLPEKKIAALDAILGDLLETL